MDALTAKSEATYTAIIAAGCEMAAAEGIGKLSLGEIAKRTGISKSGVFSRVGSLEALQIAVLDEYDRRFAEQVFLPTLQLPRGLPRLTAQVSNWIRRACDEALSSACLYTAGAFEFDDQDGGVLRDRLQDGALRWRASMRKTILQAMEAGQLRPDTEPEQLVFEIYSLIVGLVHDVRFLRDADAPRHMQRAFNRLISTYKSFNDME
ncbi:MULTISPECIES: TetR/AcrR family transcriptional regulator [unclassified Massilia]|uniref:TetR/AcrR family transcriptional regulator n=1 Tax=unclassified Massilia TaxID=2609279 RepID=UPI0015945300|nr:MULTISPECIES: TetR/AcrR family transcriptional regulator [unclassified Massilia]NVD96491.1 TetR/AcrR family transcriptional regulator [Massilia sp. BJB1822]UTY57380.1 TetR/AcrR family transcriptional regulator [Massilia sp. erpn]